jgi:hypothetical protein
MVVLRLWSVGAPRLSPRPSTKASIVQGGNRQRPTIFPDPAPCVSDVLLWTVLHESIRPMNRLSSRQTFFYKHVYPVCVLGGMGLAILWWAFWGPRSQAATVIPLWCVIGVASFYTMRVFLADLADAVMDGGDFLLVRNGDDEIRVALQDIAAVEGSRVVRPQRVVLKLANAGRFGRRIAFVPAMDSSTFIPIAQNGVVDALAIRIAKAKSSRHVNGDR